MPISEEELRRVFRAIDSDNSGSISERELMEAMLVWRVKVSGNSAARVLAMVDKDGNGGIEWPEFQAFFGKVSNPDEIKNLLSAENQRFFEYKMMVESDPSFAKTFAIPPLISPEHQLDGHSGDVEALAWLSDTSLLSGGIDGDILLWDVSTGGKKPTLRKQWKDSSLYTLALAGDGRHFITGHGRRSSNICLWSTAEANRVAAFTSHNEPVYSSAYAHDSSSFASGGKSGRICIFSETNPAPLQSWEGHTNVVQSIDFRKDGSSVMCTSSRDGTVKVFDTRLPHRDSSAEVVIEDAAASGPVNEALWRNSSEVVSCGDDYCMKRWDVRYGASVVPLSSYFGHTSVVRAIALSKDGHFLASGTQSGGARVWLVDELGLVRERIGTAKTRLGDLEVLCHRQQEQNEAGEGDIQELKDTVSSMKAVEGEISFLKDVQREREVMACTQAKLGLVGKTWPVNVVAWRDLGGDRACVACGYQDQSIRLFHVDTQELARLETWDKPTG